jgi:hypothetical protein
MKRPNSVALQRGVTYGAASALAASAGLAIVYGLQGAYATGRCMQPLMLSRVSVCSPVYAQGSELSVAAAIFFAVTLVVAISPRVALVVTFALLNLLFAWTSRLLEALSSPLYLGVGRVISIQNGVLWYGLGLERFTQFTQAATDLEGLLLLGLLASLVVLLNARRGTGKALLRSLRATGLCVAILGIEVAAFDRGEFYRHVTDVQLILNLAPWFSNADLLLGAAGAVVLSSALLRGNLLAGRANAVNNDTNM